MQPKPVPPKLEAKVSCRLKASPEQVYDAWLDPGKIHQWLAAALKNFGLPGELTRIETDPRVGGKFYFADMRAAGEAKHWGTYYELERPRRIVFSWLVAASEEADPSRVTLTLERDGRGCLAKIVHEIDPEWRDYIAQTEKGWTGMLEQIGTMFG